MRISLCKDGYRHTTTGKDATKDVMKREMSTWQRNIVTRREVRAGYEVGGRRNENQEVRVNIEVGMGEGLYILQIALLCLLYWYVDR